VAQVVWREVETPDPEAFQRFHGKLWGWEYERAFADTELGADYWIIQDAGKGIGGLQRSVTGAQRRPELVCTLRLTTRRRPCSGSRLWAGRLSGAGPRLAAMIAGSRLPPIRAASPSVCGPSTSQQ
jgi:hypothetical protein